MTDYVALTGIKAPNTAVYGYQRGDLVHENVVQNWGLTVGSDVAEGTELPDDAEPVAPMERPGAEGTRADWEKWAIYNGLPEASAAVASQDELEAVTAPEPDAVPDDEPSEQGEQPVRPADSAAKAEWVDYAIALGADPQWARDSTTTKANLQAYEPPVGDTVAVAATEANQG